MISYDTIFLLFACLLLYVYLRLRKTYSYFERHGIPYIKPENWILGNMTGAFWHRKPLLITFYEFHRELEPHKFGGIFQLQKPSYMIRDPELIKRMLVKDFEYFPNRANPPVSDADPLNKHLFNLKDDEWKNLRIKLTGTFTSGKMKMMFPLVNDCAQKLHQVLQHISDQPFDMKDLVARFTTDVIGSCAFGLETGCLENPNNQFRDMARRIFEFRYKKLIPLLFPKIPAKVVKLFKMTFIEEKVEQFFSEMVENSVRYREENKVSRFDFLDLLIAMKNNTTMEKYHDSSDKEDVEKFLAQIGGKVMKSNVDMTIQVLIAQCLLFFQAGFETSSNALAFLFLEIAQNQEIQNKVRDEINSLLDTYDGEVTYNFLKEMTYSDMVIAETLRKYPPTGILIRENVKNYKIPDTNVIIPATSPIIISLLGLHNDGKYYEKPNEFYPEHFTEEAIANRPHNAYMPFGDGPRVCIAERFAKMQIKTGLVYLLKDSVYRLSPKMEIPFQFQNDFGLLSAKGGIWLQREEL